MKLQLILLFLMTLTASLFAVHWKIDKDFVADKYRWNEVQSRSQMTAVSHSIETELKGIADIIELTYPQIALAKKDFASSATDHRLLMLGMAKLSGAEWILDQKFFAENVNIKNWSPSYITLALRSVSAQQLAPNAPVILTLLDPQRKPYVLVVTRSLSDQSVLVGLMKGDLFQGLVDRQKGQISQFAIVNTKGQVLGHSIREYIGSQMSDDSMVAEIMSAQSVSGSGFFQSLNDEKVQGFYEQVGETNLYLSVVTPVAQLMRERSQIRLRFILMGIGIGLIGVAALIFLYRPETKASEEEVAVVAAKSKAAPPSQPIVQPAPAEKIAAYSQVAAEISNELTAPLTSILSQVHLAKAQAKTPEELSQLERIESEARSSRDVVEKLKVISGQENQDQQLQSISAALRKALKSIDGLIHRMGVQLAVEIEETPERLYPSQLSVAIENLLNNAVESMERQHEKKLKVELKSQGQGFLLSIQDSGEGMSSDVQSQLFAPFFSTRRDKHLGMGLAFAQAIFKESSARLSIQSQAGEGTLITIDFQPEQDQETAREPNREVPKAPMVPPHPPKQVSARPPQVELKEEKSSIPAPPSVPPLVEELMSLPSDDSFEFIEPMSVTEHLIETDPSDLSTPVVVESKGPQIEKPRINMKKKSYQAIENYDVRIRRPGDHP